MANRDKISDLMKRAAPYLTRMSDDVASDTVSKEIEALILALETHKASPDHDSVAHVWAAFNKFLQTIEVANIVPSTVDTSDIGSAERPFRKGYFSELSALETHKNSTDHDSVAHTWTALNKFLQTVEVNGVLPVVGDTSDIGSATQPFRKGFFSELSTLLFKKENVLVMDGTLVLTKQSGKFEQDVEASDTTIDFGQAITPGDFLLLRAENKMEYMQVGSLVSGTTYNVTRDLDGSGANNWPAGSVYSVRGNDGDGWLELNAIDRKRFSVWAQGSAWNTSLEIGRYGDITGWQNAPFTGMGIALGDYANGKYLIYTKTDGMIVNGGTIIAGDGKVIIDENGLRLFTETVYNDYTSPSSIKFIHDGVNFGGIYGSGSPSDVGIQQKINGAPGQTIHNWDIALAKDTGAVYKITTAMREGVYGNSYILDKANYEAKVSRSESLIEINAKHSRLNTDPVVYNTALLKIWARYDQSLISLTAEKIDLTAPDGIVVNGALKDGDGVAYLKSTGKAADSDKLDGLDSTDFGRPVFLTTPLTSTAWDGDTKGIGDRAIVDLSTVFGVPAGVKAVLMSIQTQADAANDYIRFGPDSGNNFTLICRTTVASQIAHASGIVPCDANGDVYCYTSATNVEGVWVWIWGYWL